jgi:hypothetical protein
METFSNVQRMVQLMGQYSLKLPIDDQTGFDALVESMDEYHITVKEANAFIAAEADNFGIKLTENLVSFGGRGRGWFITEAYSVHAMTACAKELRWNWEEEKRIRQRVVCLFTPTIVPCFAAALCFSVQIHC